MPGQKKRKLSSAPSISSKRRKKHAALPKRVVDADALRWKNIPVPDMYDDAEGFYGLEEVTGVEIVRTGTAVQFVGSKFLLRAESMQTDSVRR